MRGMVDIWRLYIIILVLLELFSQEFDFYIYYYRIDVLILIIEYKFSWYQCLEFVGIQLLFSIIYKCCKYFILKVLELVCKYIKECSLRQEIKKIINIINVGKDVQERGRFFIYCWLDYDLVGGVFSLEISVWDFLKDRK